MRRTHGAEKLSCPSPGCEVKFVSGWGRNRHIKIGNHKENGRYKKENLETEEAKGGEGGGKAGFMVKTVECVVKGCGRMFYARLAMEDHMRRSHGAEKLSCPAPGCGVKFVSGWGRNRHVKLGHHKENGHYKKNLKAQESVVVQQVKKRVDLECDVEGCLARFSPYNQRKEDHMRMEHGQSKLVCEMCEASFFSQDGLSRHMKKVHKEVNDATKRDLGDERDKDQSNANVGNMGDKLPIAVKVKEPEVEMLDMEIF